MYNQSSQVEGRIHHDLLQKAGNLQYQLLMARSIPDYHYRPSGPLDGFLQTDVDDGRHGTLLQQGDQPGGSRDVSPLANVDNGGHGTPPQDSKVPHLINFNKYDVLDDVPQQATADNDRQGPLSPRGSQPDPRDVSQLAEVDNGRHGLLPQHGGYPSAPHDDPPTPDVDNDHQGPLSTGR